MHKIFSSKQIERAWHLIHDHNLTIEQIADIMDCSQLNAKQLCQAAVARFGKKKERTSEVKKVSTQRPKAEYSNHSPMGVAS